MERSELVKSHFDTKWMKFGEYDKFILKVAPGYKKMHKEVVRCCSLLESCKKVLDLGVGTGETSAALIEKFNCHVDGVDISSNMIEKAKERLAGLDVVFIESDIKDFTPSSTYDLVVSVIAIHHLHDEDKKKLFERVYGCLNEGGMFVVADRVNFVDNEKRIDDYKEFLNGIWGNRVGEELFEMFDKEDVPGLLSDQLEWMKEIGFRDVSKTWDYSIYAVFCGKK